MRLFERKPTPVDNLDTLLREGFSLEAFRPYQEEACREVTSGRDVLLVMPTGAGKSLCYQLPGIARAGTTLVISPLIALMEDQTAQLRAGGFAAERIHSGRDRGESRRVCQDYLDGGLDFLFIAPERLSVPGFPEMLARRKPVLIAIDEAHCISHWGHDFRPEYRMLKERLPLLRPAPVIALTATATPLVQRDIVDQLGLDDALQFIHGFRRSNIAIEMVDLRPSLRAAATERLLSDPANRPAIVYAPTRRQAEELAERLTARFPTAPYHAGLTATRRDEAQAGFLKGHLDVVVATIAFGMGIDKANVRTVIHTAMPGSVEAYYQEIGRAGRDGLPSRAVLLHGYVDRRTHEFFLDRDYPEPAQLERIYNELNAHWQSKDALLQRVRIDPDDLDRKLEKLWIHGGANVDPEENVKRGDERWRRAYQAQRRHKWAELDLITGYAGCRECRMLHLLRHFGDRDARGDACGLCDFCRPDDCQVLKFTEPSHDERRAMTRVLKALDERDDQATGRLHREIFGESLARDDFENLLGALARAGLGEVRDDAFERDGKVIRFRRVCTTDRGRTDDAVETVRVPVSPELGLPASKPARRRRSPKKAKTEDKPFHQTIVELPMSAADASPELIAALREWRLAEARRRRVPAFRILSNRSLTAIAEARPQDEAGLLRIHGMGSKRLEKFGQSILQIVRSSPD
jgi:DNA topoisomerase-3